MYWRMTSMYHAYCMVKPSIGIHGIQRELLHAYCPHHATPIYYHQFLSLLYECGSLSFQLCVKPPVCADMTYGSLSCAWAGKGIINLYSSSFDLMVSFEDSFPFCLRSSRGAVFGWSGRPVGPDVALRGFDLLHVDVEGGFI